MPANRTFDFSVSGHPRDSKRRMDRCRHRPRTLHGGPENFFCAPDIPRCATPNPFWNPENLFCGAGFPFCGPENPRCAADFTRAWHDIARCAPEFSRRTPGFPRCAPDLPFCGFPILRNHLHSNALQSLHAELKTPKRKPIP